MASKRAIRRRACMSKVRHETKAAAMRARWKYHSRGCGLSAYQCRFCGGWHIGHGPKR